MVQKLDLKMDPNPKPYKLSWLQEGSDIKVKHRCLVSFTIGKHYQDEVWCDVVPMDVCHLLLGRPWQYDRQIIYDGFKNTYTFRKDGHKIDKEYSTYDKEFYAIYRALFHWSQYLLYKPFVLFSYHEALKFINHQHKLNRRHATWVEFLQAYNFTIRHKASVHNIVADDVK